MKIQIKNRFNDSIIFETDAETIGGAIAAAIKAKSNLSGADLSRADLSGADLYRADLSGAYLYGADLSGANLSGANLSGANLSRADLSGADLSGANLSRANLYGANLYGADLSGANNVPLGYILHIRTIVPEEGAFTAWKKLDDGTICKLLIPAEAKRVGGLVGRKCRAEFADVIEGEGVSNKDRTFRYKAGTRVTPDSFDPNPLVECSNGIHFFITRKEAEEYTF